MFLFHYVLFPTVLFYVNLVWPMIGQRKQVKSLLGFADILRGKSLTEVNTLPKTVSQTMVFPLLGNDTQNATVILIQNSLAEQKNFLNFCQDSVFITSNENFPISLRVFPLLFSFLFSKNCVGIFQTALYL